MQKFRQTLFEGTGLNGWVALILPILMIVVTFAVMQATVAEHDKKITRLEECVSKTRSNQQEDTAEIKTDVAVLKNEVSHLRKGQEEIKTMIRNLKE